MVSSRGVGEAANDVLEAQVLLGGFHREFAVMRATYSNADHAVTATLVFDEAGDLVDFVSDDRSMASSDGRTFTRCDGPRPSTSTPS